MRSALGLALALGLARPRVTGGAAVSLALSSFVAADSLPPADGSPTALTGTWRDANNAPVVGAPWTAAIGSAVDVDGAACTLVCLETEVPDDGTTPANFELRIYDQQTGAPIPGVPASLIDVVSDRGATDTVTVIDARSDRNGLVRITATSETPGTPTFSATVDNIAVTQTAGVEFTGDAPPAITPLFFSEWPTTGTSDAAITDSDKWDDINSPGGTGLEVIAATGLDFPTTNCLRVSALQASLGYAFLRVSDMPTLAVDSRRYFRGYLRIAAATSAAVADPETHPHQDGNAASQINWGIWVYHNLGGAGKWTPQVRPQASANAWPNDRWQSDTALDKDATYRWEVMIHRTATATFKMETRWYTSVGEAVLTSINFFNQNSTLNLEEYVASQVFALPNVASLTGLNAGLNGLSGTDYYPGIVYCYQGAIAVADDQGWIGSQLFGS